MKKIINLSLLLLALLLPATATAYDFKVDGIYYEILSASNKTVWVTYYDDSNGTKYSNYSGSVNIPATVTYNGTSYSVTAIGISAFINCSGLTSVTIPNSVTSISSYAFSNCSALTSISIGNSVTSIGGSAFRGCSGLTSVTIPNSVTTIGDYAFQGCSALTSISIGNSVTSIGTQAFSGCSGLTILFWNSRNCSYNGDIYTYNIEQVTIGNEVEVLPSGFVECSKITSVTIPNSVTTIGNTAFRGCSGLTRITVDSNNTVYDSRDNCNAIIKSSSNELITGCNNTIIPNSVTTIGNSAFYGCSGLTSVTIPNSVTEIGNGAFSGCSGLNDVCSFIVDPTTVSMGSSVFYRSPNYYTERTLHVPVGSVSAYQADTKWANYFGSIVEMEPAIEFADGRVKQLCLANWDNNGDGELSYDEAAAVTDLGTVFKYNTTITSFDELQYFTGLTEIASQAFSYCTNLESIIIPDNVITVKFAAFEGCSKLSNLIIGESVQTFGTVGSVLYGCRSLTSISIPKSVTSINGYCFNECDNLVSIIVEEGNPVYDSREGCNAIIETETNTLIAGCNATIIPNTVTHIGEGAFQLRLYLREISFPSSINQIDYAAFNNDAFLDNIYCYVNNPEDIILGEAVFSDIINIRPNLGIYYLPNLHVPYGSAELYRNADQWNQFNIVEMEPESVLATSVELDSENAEMTEGETLQLTATVLPEDATDKTVTWASSDEAVATVDDTGLVTAVAAGTATITATTNDGSDLSASCTVTVASPVVPVGDNILVMADTTVMHGDIIALPVAMSNEAALMAFQTDIFLPEGFTIVTDEDDEYIITPSERLSSDHVIMSDNANNGSVRVICYTPNSQPITGNEGDLFYIHVQIPDDAEGPYTINLRNTLLTTVDYTEISAPDTSAQIEVIQFIPGDVNDSRTVTVTDIVIAAQYILDRDPSPFIFEAADMNGDGTVTVTDIMLIAYLINHPTMNAPKRMPALMDCNDQMSGESVSLMAGETRTVSIVLDNEMDYTAFQMDLTLPEGLTAGHFQLTDRAGSHAFDVNAIGGNKVRALCYSPAIEVIDGHSGALLTFDVTANATVEGSITVDGIELVTTDCQSVLLNGFAIGVNTATSVNEIAGSKTVARVDYFNLAGQRIDRPESGVTLVVTTYTDGTRTTTKVMK